MTSEHDRTKLHDLLVHELEDFAVFLVGLDRRILTWNQGVERFFGYAEKEFIGLDIAEIFTPEDRAAGAPDQEIGTARSNGRSSDVRWHLRKDESRVFVEGVLVCVKDGGKIVSFAKIARAVHPKHAAGSLLTTILEGTDDAIYALDTKGRFIFANTPAASLFGQSLDSLLGRSREEILPEPVAADVRATDESVMHGSSPRLVEEEVPTARGDRVLLTTKAPWRDAEGRVLGLVALAKDITTRKAYQAERERLLREVRRSNEELAAFSHVVAHDLKAPLRAVKIYAEMLARHLSGADAASKEFLRFVTEGAEHMDQLIEALLRYAESGEELAVRRVSANAIFDGLINRIEPLIRETGARVTRGTLPDVEADPVRLLQLFQNLIVNGINYRRSEPPRVRVSAEKISGEYRFAVEDNGMGIPREHFERIFAPLKRLQSKIPGSGLGLALCRKIVERHGGRIWVESTVGAGSTFFFTLPRPQASQNRQ